MELSVQHPSVNDRTVRHKPTDNDRKRQRILLLKLHEQTKHRRPQRAPGRALAPAQSCLRRLWLASVVCTSVLAISSASALATRNVILVTLDGLRWQEVFSGADEQLLTNQRYVSNTAGLKEQFWAQDPKVRRKILLPFLWTRVAEQGQLYGNRDQQNQVNLSNNVRISYSGYNELLAGHADDKRISRNRKRYNPNITVLEFANRQPGFQGRVACFGSWYLFPWIINEPRSGVRVNAGLREAVVSPLSQHELFLNDLQRQIPAPWHGVRMDAFTHQYALEDLKKYRTRLTFIAFGETDEYAHDGRYDNYLLAAQRNDAMLRELWQWVQSTAGYRNKTTLLITTDHGRGSGRQWRDHGARVPGSEAVWLAAIGPDSSPHGEVTTATTLTLAQVAATISNLLGLSGFGSEVPVARPIASILQ